MDCGLPGSSAHGISQARILECVARQPLLLQGIFLTQESNSHLPHWRADSSLLSHRGSLFCTVRMSIFVWKMSMKVLCYHGISDSMSFQRCCSKVKHLYQVPERPHPHQLSGFYGDTQCKTDVRVILERELSCLQKIDTILTPKYNFFFKAKYNLFYLKLLLITFTADTSSDWLKVKLYQAQQNKVK